MFGEEDDEVFSRVGMIHPGLAGARPPHAPGDQELEGRPLDLPVLLAIIPLNSVKHAHFMHNEVPGIVIPDSIFKRLEDAGERAAQEGVKIAQELIAAMRDEIQGAYIIPSNGRYDLTAEIVEATASVPTQA